MKKGKDCAAIVKGVLNDIESGRKEMALEKLSDLQKDGSFLADAAKQLVEWLEVEDKRYQEEDEKLLCKIGDLNGQESELKSQKSTEENQLAAQQTVLYDNQYKLSSAEDSLRDAERKRRKAEEEEKSIQIGSTVGGALLGLFTGGVGFVVGAAAGATFGATVNACRDAEKDARGVVNRRRSDRDNARSAVSGSQMRISNIESRIRSLTQQIEHKKQERQELQKNRAEIKGKIKLLKESIDYWLLFKLISEFGVNKMELLQNIVTKATERQYHRALKSRSSKLIVNGFIEAWEEIKTTLELGRPNLISENEYRCPRCRPQPVSVCNVDESTFVCMQCHSRFTLKN